MANPFDPYEQQILGLKEQKALAQKLRESATEAPQGQMVGGWYVAPSWTQQLARGLNYMTGMASEEKAQKGIQDVMGERQRGREAWMGQIPQATTTTQQTPFQYPQMEGETPIQGLANVETKTKQPTAQEYLAWGMKGSQFDPSAMTMGSAFATVAENEQKRAEDRKARMEELQLKLADASLSRAERAATEERLARINMEGRSDIARLTAALRPAPQPQAPVAVIGPNGKPMYVSPGQAVGMSPASAGKQDDWKYDAGSDTWVMPPTAEYPMGRSTPNVGKASALKNLEYLGGQFVGTKEQPGIVDRATTGGWFGLKGAATTGTQEAREFDNATEQMSTELRKIFRIPGEGALSDKEQAQYGIQLPRRGNEPALNRRILQDLMVRAQNSVLPPTNPLQPAQPPAPPQNRPPALPPADAIAAEIARRQGRQ